MILDFTQWTRLQHNIIRAKDWFEEKSLFKGYLDVFNKIAQASLHELSQIREAKDWDTFIADIPNKLPLELILNFGNYIKAIDWPLKEENYFSVRAQLNSALEKGEDWSLKWRNIHSIFIKYTADTCLHYDPEHYGGIVYVWVITNPEGDKQTRVGIMIDEDEVVPISVEF